MGLVQGLGGLGCLFWVLGLGFVGLGFVGSGLGLALTSSGELLGETLPENPYSKPNNQKFLRTFPLALNPKL